MASSQKGLKPGPANKRNIYGTRIEALRVCYKLQNQRSGALNFRSGRESKGGNESVIVLLWDPKNLVNTLYLDQFEAPKRVIRKKAKL